MKQWYKVSWSELGNDEWCEPESILAASPELAARAMIKEDFADADQCFLGEWYACHVRLGEKEWYYKVKPARRVIVCEAQAYTPDAR